MMKWLRVWSVKCTITAFDAMLSDDYNYSPQFPQHS